MKISIHLRVAVFAILLLISHFLSFSQENFHVTGKVSDETGKPMANVNVIIKGTRSATITGPDGAFELNIPSGNATLIISFVGYEMQQLSLDNRHAISISMKPAGGSLNDVIVVGYGTQKRANVTGAVATLKNENLDERAITRVDQALVGQLAGVTVKQTTGVPGKAFSIQVRGAGSIGAGNEPLYVLDGFPLSQSVPNSAGNFTTGGNPLDNINPADIESVEVLKDAAAAAIYGARASGGVVLITTKRGHTGKPRVTLNSYAGYNEASKKLKMLNGPQWIDRATEMINANYVATYAAKGAKATDDSATRRANVGSFNVNYFLDPRWSKPGYPGLEFVDWQQDIERKGLMSNNEISASGGNESVKYFISGNFTNQDGFVKSLGYKAYSGRANVEVAAAKNLKLGLNLAPTYSITQDPGVEGKDNIFHQSLSMSPVQEDTMGLLANIGQNGQYIWSNTTNSPIGKLANMVGTTKRFRTLGTIYGEYEIIKGLTLRSSVNLDNTDNIATTFVPYTVTGTQLSRTFDPTKPPLSTGSSGTYNSYKRQTFVNENTLNYAKVFGDVHSFNVLVGQSYNYDRLDRASLSSSGGFNSSVIQTLNAAVAVTGFTNSTKNILISYFSRLQYAYKDKYLLSASLREDGSSRFGPNVKYGVFPSASLGWRVIQENFMSHMSVLSDLKLRGSVGVNGNNNLPGDYPSIAALGSYGYVLGTTPAAVIGQAPSVLNNPNIQWERSVTYDLGLDFGLFVNRITGSLDYYNKLSTKLLLNAPVPEISGQQIFLSNVGSVRNIGLELEVTSHNLVGKLQWNTSINISHNTNKLIALGGGQSKILIPSSFDIAHSILQVGKPLYSIYVVKQIGILTQDDITKNAAVFGSETVGDPKYQDINKDGVIDANDRQIVGHPNPNYVWGITNNFRFAGFDLSILVQGQNGGSIYSLLGRALTRTGQGFTDNAPAFYNQRWRSPSDPGAGRVSKAYSTFGRIVNTDWLYSSDYIRVRDITLGYNLGGLFKGKAVQGAHIYVTAENFFGHDKYFGGLNPESVNTDVSGNVNFPEAGDYGGLPLAKSLIVGLNFTF